MPGEGRNQYFKELQMLILLHSLLASGTDDVILEIGLSSPKGMGICVNFSNNSKVL